MRRRALLGAVVAVAAGASGGCAGHRARSDASPPTAAWVATWGAAPQLTEPRNMPPAPGLSGATLRQVVRVSLGGDVVRLRVSNRFGDGPLTIHSASLAPSAGGGAIVRSGARALTFGGAGVFTIAPGQTAQSDPLPYALAPLSDQVVTLAFGDVPPAVTGHPGSRTTSYLARGDAAADSLPGAATTEHWYVATGLDVARGGAAVVVLGNSIADGRGSGTNRQNRWPDNLARRLHDARRTARVAVVNQGIGGNCVLRECIGPSGLERLDRDVLAQPGARWLIVSEGVNDIGGARGAAASAATADSLIAAFRRIVERAHARGLRAYGATILPFGGSQYDAPEHERARQSVNAWIRTGGAFDAVIDLDAAMRDPQRPERLRSDVDGGDHLHPNEQGYRMMADAIDLALFVR